MGQSDEKKDDNDKASVEEKMIMKRLNKNRQVLKKFVEFIFELLIPLIALNFKIKFRKL
jgi:hypothetical protein